MNRTNPATGADIYNADGTVDWQQYAATGATFCYCKATEGVSLIDAHLQRNMDGMKQFGILRGAYHFLRLAEDSKQQMAHFMNAVRNADFDFDNDLPLCLDIEDRDVAETISKNEVVERVATFLDALEAEAGKLSLMYLDRDFAESYMFSGYPFAGHPLWIANYSTADAPKIPAGWTNWKFWQNGERGTITGIPNRGGVDTDKFNGSIEDLKAFALLKK